MAGDIKSINVRLSEALHDKAVGVGRIRGLNGRVQRQADERWKREEAKPAPTPAASVKPLAVPLKSEVPAADLELIGGLDGTKGVRSESGMKISGRVKNNRAAPYRYVQISFDVFDPGGDKVGTGLANVAGLDAGGTWRFEAHCFCPAGKRYKLAGISGY